jgi:glycosyltransferase involved in cell wall biosynthesis
MHILWLDPFHGGSHAAVAAGYAARSAHEVELLTMPTTGGWRWRMRGGAVTLARMACELRQRPDLIVASDMLDLATFRGLSARRLGGVPVAVYFHENQLTYPLPAGRARDLSFAWLNYTTALSADTVLFNSDFHRRDFLGALPGLLGRYHDYRELETIAQIEAKSQVLPPGIDLVALDASEATTRPGHEQSCHDRPQITQITQMRNGKSAHATTSHEDSAQALTTKPAAAEEGPPVILWNARWDYDKQPGLFFAALELLEARGADFRLIVAGEQIDPRDQAYLAARARWAARTLHWGYAPTRAAYGALLRRATLVASAALQEFFGIGVVEALYCGCAPVLPRRLNYPELLPPGLHADWLYSGEVDGLADGLATALARVEATSRTTWRALAAPYDWAVLAPRYDQLLGQLA